MLKGPMIEQRLARLLECDSIEYFVQYLMEFAQALSNAGLPVNPHSLQRDLAHWGKEAQIEWAAAFWQGTE
jgi:CRISPR type I-E-associated protein CasB/Cse2